MRALQVKDKHTEKEFLQVAVKLYEQEENWIRPLDKDINSVFDPAKNKNFKHGEAIRWVLKDENDKLIGRVAAFINKKTSKSYDQPTGGMGFFECINDKEAAFMLFNEAKKWLEARGMEAVDGPINFWDRNNWWGLLVDGFYEPNYQMPYNFPYYQDLFEAYGFKEYFKQFTYQRPMGSEVDFTPRFYERAQRTLDNPDYEFRHITKKEFGKSHEYFQQVYNNNIVINQCLKYQ